MQQGPAALGIDGLTLSRGARVLFRDLSFSLRAGEFLSLEGPNGAGKTSLLRAIAGFLDPDKGAITLRTQSGDVLGEAEVRAPFVGWLGEKDGAKAQMTPREALHFFARFYRSAADVEAMLSAMGLTRQGDLPVQYLSAGQRRRLALARLSLSARPLWLLDEPFAALDGDGKRTVADSISAHCRAGGLAIAATHEPMNVEGNRVVLGSPAA